MARHIEGNGSRVSLRDIAGEGILLAGGARAILLQIAFAPVGAGVARHSDFAHDPLARLRGTMTYVYAVVYGSPAEVTAVRQRVNRAHRSVKGDEPPPGYNAFDPHAQLWVAATLYESGVSLYERVFGTLDAASADRVYQEWSVLGTTLQVPAELWPADRGAFRDYWNETLSTLTITADARRISRELLQPKNVPWWMRALMPLVALVTAGLLPPRLRRDYGFAWSPRLHKRFDTWMLVIGAVVRRLPRRARHALSTYYLAQLRRELAAARRPAR